MTEKTKLEIENPVFIASLIARWGRDDWAEVAAFCQGAALVCVKHIEELGLLNSIAWRRNE